MHITASGKILIYSAVFMALAVNSPQLFALREHNYLAQMAGFDVYEFAFRVLYSFLYCGFFFYFNSRKQFYSSYATVYRRIIGIVINFLLLIVFARIGTRLNHAFFDQGMGILPGSGYFLRLVISAMLMAIELKIIYLLNTNKQKELENEYLRNAYLKAELEVLKGQLNPHFFFNTLSSLSGVVREDAVKAQHYIGQLSKFFRYTLKKTSNSLVPLGEELAAIGSYLEILKMRHEEGIAITIQIEKEFESMLIPHMSLQPLVENAVKHNFTDAKHPLLIRLYIDNNTLVITNNLQPPPAPEPGNGIGLVNLNERYRILTGREITICQAANEFVVQLPLTEHAT